MPKRKTGFSQKLIFKTTVGTFQKLRIALNNKKKESCQYKWAEIKHVSFFPPPAYKVTYFWQEQQCCVSNYKTVRRWESAKFRLPLTNGCNANLMGHSPARNIFQCNTTQLNATTIVPRTICQNRAPNLHFHLSLRSCVT